MLLGGEWNVIFFIGLSTLVGVDDMEPVGYLDKN